MTEADLGFCLNFAQLELAGQNSKKKPNLLQSKATPLKPTPLEKGLFFGLQYCARKIKGKEFCTFPRRVVKAFGGFVVFNSIPKGF